MVDVDGDSGGDVAVAVPQEVPEAVTEFVDLGRYPIHEPHTPAWRAAIDAIRQDLARSGCSVLPDFVRADRRAELQKECAAVAPDAHFAAATVNVYNVDVDASLPSDHPARIPMERTNAFTARDRIPAGDIVQRLYGDRGFQHFLAACFGLEEVHELADPLAGLCLNVCVPGKGHPWHFDTNEFAVSLLTQEPEGGGVFQYCPDIRTPQDEHFDDVRAVVEGRGGERVKNLMLRPGDLQLFRGRYALHRVTPVSGARERHTAIFSYSERPGVVGNPVRTQQLFGRVLDAHRARPVRVDGLLD